MMTVAAEVEPALTDAWIDLLLEAAHSGRQGRLAQEQDNSRLRHGPVADVDEQV